MKKKILIVEDQKLFRQMLTELLSEYEIFECVTGEMALDILPKYEPDLIILDLFLPGISGLELIEEFERKTKAVIMILTANTDESFVKALCLHVKQYLIKDYEELPELKRRVADCLTEKEVDTPPYIMKMLYYSMKEALSNAEMRVMWLMRKGLSSLEIAKQLFISVNTVNNHRKAILRKLNIKNTYELIVRKAG
jgi:DNA-binding NarL/FixJ family response regulator